MKLAQKATSSSQEATTSPDTSAPPTSSTNNPTSSAAMQEEENPAVKPKPFLKRKTKTMQPAKINWKTKSRIDCWGGQSKP